MSGEPSVAVDRWFEDRFGLDDGARDRVFGQALEGRSGWAELYLEHAVREVVELEDGSIRKASRHLDAGAGVRVVSGERTGYTYTEDVQLDPLLDAARAARAIARDAGADDPTASVPIRSERDLYPVRREPTSAPTKDRVDLLRRIEETARAQDPRIVNVLAHVVCEDRKVLVSGSEGWLTHDSRPLVRVSIQCVAEDGGRRETGVFGGGGRFELGRLEDEPLADDWAREAARQAILNLDAVPAPAGTMPVVLGPGWPGILLHEAIGHGLEGDFNRKGTSAFSGRIGERVASELCTVVDDGTIPGRRGSLNVDDEGTPTSRTVLIEKGILRGYLQDRLNASLMGMEPTGNGRRESYAHPPMPRMTNTFMLAGEDDPEDILRSVKKGLYAVSFGGGQVDIVSGKFVFSANEAYLVEDGEIGPAVKGATLIGNGPDVLTRVTRVGSDLALDTGVGMCGKEGQGVPVGVGLPTILVDGLTVGGTQA